MIKTYELLITKQEHSGHWSVRLVGINSTDPDKLPLNLRSPHIPEKPMETSHD